MKGKNILSKSEMKSIKGGVETPGSAICAADCGDRILVCQGSNCSATDNVGCSATDDLGQKFSKKCSDQPPPGGVS